MGSKKNCSESLVFMFDPVSDLHFSKKKKLIIKVNRLIMIPIHIVKWGKTAPIGFVKLAYSTARKKIKKKKGL